MMYMRQASNKCFVNSEALIKAMTNTHLPLRRSVRNCFKGQKD